MGQSIEGEIRAALLFLFRINFLANSSIDVSSWIVLLSSLC